MTLEIIIANRFSEFEQKHDPLTEFQRGFHKELGTESLKELILTALEEKKLDLGIFVDLA